MQQSLFERAAAYRDEHTRTIDSRDEFYEFFTPRNMEQPESHGGFAMTHWCGEQAVEEQIKSDLGVTVRCIPIRDEHEGAGVCPFTGRPSKQRVVWAKSY